MKILVFKNLSEKARWITFHDTKPPDGPPMTDGPARYLYLKNTVEIPANSIVEYCVENGFRNIKKIDSNV